MYDTIDVGPDVRGVRAAAPATLAAGLADTRWRCDGPAPALAP